MVNQSSVIAVDVGGTSVKGSVVDDGGRVRESSSLPTPSSPGEAVDAIHDLVRTLLAAAPDPQAIGLMVPGHVDPATGVAVYSANLGWRDVPLRRLLTQEFGLPVAVNHDVTAGSLAELRFGGHEESETDDAVVVQLGTGIAATIVSSGVVLRGAEGLAGEFGHIPVVPDGEPCPCGQCGCLERYSSAAAIARRYREAGGDSDVDAAGLVHRLSSDVLAGRIWADAVDRLADGLATVTMLLDPRLIVLTGGLSAAGGTLLTPLQDALERRVTWRARPRVAVSSLGPRVGVAGAALLAWHEAGQRENARWAT